MDELNALSQDLELLFLDYPELFRAARRIPDDVRERPVEPSTRGHVISVLAPRHRYGGAQIDGPTQLPGNLARDRAAWAPPGRVHAR
jgi:hypothetical protein